MTFTVCKQLQCSGSSHMWPVYLISSFVAPPFSNAFSSLRRPPPRYHGNNTGARPSAIPPTNRTPSPLLRLRFHGSGRSPGRRAGGAPRSRPRRPALTSGPRARLSRGSAPETLGQRPTVSLEAANTMLLLSPQAGFTKLTRSQREVLLSH